MNNLILSFGDNVLVHFGGDSLHFSQEWCSIEDVKLKE